MSRHSSKSDGGYPFSQERSVNIADDGKLVYRSTDGRCLRLPEQGDKRFSQGLSRNFEIFSPLDFLAELTQHPPSSRVTTADKHPQGGLPDEAV